MEQSTIDTVLKQVDIVSIISQYLPLTKRGRDYIGICPFHDDTSPSLYVSSEKQICKCFACNEGGNAISFIQKFEKCDFKTAYNKVIELGGLSEELKLKIMKEPTYDPYDADQRKMIKMNEGIQEYLKYRIQTNVEGCLNFVNERGIDDKCISQFGLGYLDDINIIIKLLEKKYKYTIDEIRKNDFFRFNDNGKVYSPYVHRITIPIYDQYQNLLGFAGRSIPSHQLDGPKYINPSTTSLFEKSNILYNLYNARNSEKSKKEIYIVEGYMDAISMSRNGYGNTVALMGTALTKNHIEILSRIKDKEFIFVLDGDRAGQESMHKIYKQLAGTQLRPRFVILPDGKDPDDMFKMADLRMDTLLSNYLCGFEFEIKYQQSLLNDKTSFIKKKQQIMEIVQDFAKDNHDYLDKAYFTSLLSDTYGIDIESVKNYYREEEKKIQSSRNRMITSQANDLPENKRYTDRKLRGDHRK